MKTNELNKFSNTFDKYCDSNDLNIVYTKERSGVVIQKVRKVFTKNDEIFLQELEIIPSKNIRKIVLENEKITESSLTSKHSYLATLFSTLTPTPVKQTSTWQDFKSAKSKIQWIICYFILDTRLIGGLIGRIIAYSANKENPHYKTIPSHILGKTLKPLIFPAGSKKPRLEKKGTLLIDSILHKQYKALKNYNGQYVSKTDPKTTIDFMPKKVPMKLGGETIDLETVVASNKCVKKDKDHLHIVYFNGNSGCFQHDYKFAAEDLVEFSKKGVPVTAVQFNYPGILNSGGEVEYSQELIDSGITQVNQLLKEGVSPKNIVLHGVSLGGSISSHVAAHFYKKQGKLLGGLYASRTFASTAQVGRDFFNRALGNNIVSWLISMICLPLIKLGTWGTGWDLDTGKAFFSLPRNIRNYSVVISPRKNRTEYLENQSRTIIQKFFDCILMKQPKPADDAILGRGLHNSLEKIWESILTKCGCYGSEARESYSKKNRSKKMVVIDFEKYQLAPDVDGHAKADYTYLLPNENSRRINPRKEKTIGLVHQSLLAGTLKKTGNIRHLLTSKREEVNEHEAGTVFRNWVLKVTKN